MKTRYNLHKKDDTMEAAPDQTFHTHDEHLRDNPYLEQKVSAKVIEIVRQPVSKEEYEEPHEYNGFGD